ncbi:MAG TPA: hypothetical protein VM716_02690 [Gemmatimonadales bacterium]|nr:hypothetical protein [Gemmatimonadales bacterium]
MLTVHLALSVGWIGAVVAYLVLGISAVRSGDPQVTRAAWIAMELTGWYAIVPLAVGSLLTGIVMALGTPWGLFRHYWVLISFTLTVFCVTILLLHMPTVSSQAQVARTADPAVLSGLGGDLFHPSVGLLLLLVITVLNVYKPRGLTPYGRRKQLEAGLPAEPGTTTAAWVTTSAIVAVGLVLLLALLHHIEGGGMRHH